MLESEWKKKDFNTQGVWKQVESLNQEGGLTPPGVFTREKVNLPALVTLARR